MAFVDLHWIALGAGGPRIVGLTGRVYALLMRRAPYHAALTAEVDGARWTIEVAPSPDAALDARGAIATGPVGCRWSPIRYEVRCWRGGTIPDLALAASTVRLTDDPAVVRRVLDLVHEVPTPVWLRWNSNSMVAWVLAHAGLADGVAAPPGGCAPGWAAGNYGRAPRPAPDSA